jgi:TetR/AcrR family transcriptional regulator
MVNTEQKIFDAARKVFLKKGLNGARMQEIADEAKINKALLHYYFRSKEQLFYAIFQEAFKTMVPFVSDLFNSDSSLEVKISRLSEKYFAILNNNRYIPLFILNEIQQNPEKVSKLFNLQHIIDWEKLTAQIKAEYGLMNVEENFIRHTFINFLSNMIFPFVGRPLLQYNLKMSDEEYENFLKERISLIPLIFISTIKLMNVYATHDN